jgi:hypothetical protein
MRARRNGCENQEYCTRGGLNVHVSQKFPANVTVRKNGWLTGETLGAYNIGRSVWGLDAADQVQSFPFRAYQVTAAKLSANHTDCRALAIAVCRLG